MAFALEGTPKNNPSLATSPNSILFTPRFYQSSQLIDEDKLNGLMACGNALSMLQNFTAQYTLGQEHKVLTLQDVAQLVNNDTLTVDERITLESVKQALRKELSGRIIQANYSKTSYIIIDVNFKQNPLSTFSKYSSKLTSAEIIANHTCQDETVQYLEYFNQKGLVINDLTQPLISVSLKALDRINRTAADHSDKFIASTEPEINLVPELCSIFGLTAEIRALSKLLPSLIIHTNDTQLAFDKIARLEDSLEYRIKDKKLKKRVRTDDNDG